MEIKRILIVDDDAPLLHAIKRGLRDINAEILTFNPIDCPAAIEETFFKLIAERSFDLIVMDGEMPGTSGVKLTRGLREKGYPGYIIANSSMPELSLEMLEAGADIENNFNTKAYVFNFFDL